MQSWRFYQAHLGGVSRSFAFCIAQLPQPQRVQVGLAYLLFRVVDTIEDYQWPSQDQQQSQFLQFASWLEYLPDASQVAHWYRCFPDDITPQEQALLKDIFSLLVDFHHLPELIKLATKQGLVTMIGGMQHFLQICREADALELRSTVQVNQYCFFVAGIVGELLTQIFQSEMIGTCEPSRLLLNGFHFGLFLQKVNILKDYQQDLAQGRALIPDRDSLRDSVAMHAQHALAYIHAISPTLGRPYRLFCGWSLFIGLASLKWIDRSYQTGERCKIPYFETLAVMFEVRKRAAKDADLTDLLQRYLPQQTEIPREHLGDLELPIWFSRLYTNPLLSTTGAAELGLV